MIALYKKSLFILVLLALISCTGVPVATDYDTEHDFSTIKTYAWLEPKAKLIIDPYVDNDLMNQRLHRAIDLEMEKRGYSKITSKKEADILVSYHLSSHEKLSAVSYNNHFGYYPCRGCWGGGIHHSDVSIRQYREGSFIIDFIDPEKLDLLWRGVSERRLPGSVRPQERDAYVNETVGAIIARFPPK